MTNFPVNLFESACWYLLCWAAKWWCSAKIYWWRFTLSLRCEGRNTLAQSAQQPLIGSPAQAGLNRNTGVCQSSGRDETSLSWTGATTVGRRRSPTLGNTTAVCVCARAPNYTTLTCKIVRAINPDYDRVSTCFHNNEPVGTICTAAVS